ncbi:MAG: indole-3-glycerol phosphate synthase TrpC [Gemmatimonadales bacterium]
MTDEAHARAATLASRAVELGRDVERLGPVVGFADALRGEFVKVVAEVKRSSPSKGLINPGLDLAKQVVAYESGGAAAISVLTEPTRFGGSNEDLTRARAAVRIPLLKKDFHVEAVQILEARALGASAALVIARAVSPARLGELMAAGNDAGIEILVEVRDERELELALTLGARLVGVNNRNLETLEIDPETALRLLPLIPADVIAIAESGVRTAKDVERLAASGADAVLVGTEVSAASDPEKAVRSITGIKRTTGARKS